jgi:hypothetical protein
MWNDEDNNPYGTSFDRRDSQTSSSANPLSPKGRDFRPHTPTSESEDDMPHRQSIPTTVTSVGEDEPHHAQQDAESDAPKRKPGGYESRVEQILYENPRLPIIITDAGKSLESGGRYIVYTIRTGVRSPPCGTRP